MAHEDDESTPDRGGSEPVVFRKDGSALTEADLRRLAEAAQQQVARTWPSARRPR